MFLYNRKEPAVKSALCRIRPSGIAVTAACLFKFCVIACFYGYFYLSSQINKP